MYKRSASAKNDQDTLLPDPVCLGVPKTENRVLTDCEERSWLDECRSRLSIRKDHWLTLISDLDGYTNHTQTDR